MVLRQDGTLARLLDEVRAVHAQIDHMNDRVRKLEASDDVHG
jgi:ubiquinone biosynthesis protein UbiJ